MNSIPHPEENPFRRKAPAYYGREEWVEDGTAYDRIHRLQEFNSEQLRQVLALPNLQTTVRVAAERRLRKLQGPPISYRT